MDYAGSRRENMGRDSWFDRFYRERCSSPSFKFYQFDVCSYGRGMLYFTIHVYLFASPTFGPSIDTSVRDSETGTSTGR